MIDPSAFATPLLPGGAHIVGPVDMAPVVVAMTANKSIANTFITTPSRSLIK
ncbi:MAG: hypothetical protein ACK45R_03985 [Candidatus Kapaibacterium sp.]